MNLSLLLREVCSVASAFILALLLFARCGDDLSVGNKTLIDQENFKVIQKSDGGKVFTGKLGISVSQNLQEGANIEISHLGLVFSADKKQSQEETAVFNNFSAQWVVNVVDFPLDQEVTLKLSRSTSDQQTDEISKKYTVTYNASKQILEPKLEFVFDPRLSWTNISQAWRKALNHAIGKGKVNTAPSQEEWKKMAALTTLKWRGKTTDDQKEADYEHTDSKDKIGNISPLKILTNLTRIELQGNSITALNLDDLSHMKPSHLNLANNTIDKISSSSGTKISTLNLIDLSSNKLTSAELSSLLEAVAGFSKVEKIFLYGQTSSQAPWSAMTRSEIRLKFDSSTEIYFDDKTNFINGAKGTDNTPPSTFKLQSPADASSDVVANSVKLTWDPATDPDADFISYDVYLDTKNPPSKSVVTAFEQVTYSHTKPLNPSTQYFWKVVAKDGRGGTKESSVYSFTTLERLDWNALSDNWKKALNHTIGKGPLTSEPSEEDFEKIIKLKVLKWRFKTNSNQNKGDFDFDREDEKLETLAPLRYLIALEEIDFRGNKFGKIDNLYFQHLKSLKRLDLSYCELTAITEKPFKGLASLNTLDIGHNGLTSLPPKIFEGLSALTTLSFEHNAITSLDAKIFQDLKELYTLEAAHNKITALPETILQNREKLYYISFADNEIAAISQNTFKKTPSLAKVHMEGNALTSLPQDAFKGIATLTDLRFERNKISSLPSDIFKGLSRLQTLYLSDNAISALPSTNIFDDLTGLTDLTLSNNGFTTFPKDVFAKLAALKKLFAFQKNHIWSDLQKMKIRQELLKTTEIYFDDDKNFLKGTKGTNQTPTLDALSNAPGNFHNVELTFSWTKGQDTNGDPLRYDVYFGKQNPPTAKIATDLSSTQYVHAMKLDQPLTGGVTYYWKVVAKDGKGGEVDQVGSFAALSDFLNWTSLSNAWKKMLNYNNGNREDKNKNTDIPTLAKFKEMLAIKELRWRGKDKDKLYTYQHEKDEDKIVDLTPLKHFESLTHVELSANKISSIPTRVFDQTLKLSHLDLTFNQITKILSGVFNGLSKLQELRLFENEIASIASSAFDGMTSLHHINLSSNKLTTVDKSWFKDLKSKLSNLQIDGNSITTIASDAFDGLSRMDNLNLSTNQLTSITKDWFDDMPSLTTFWCVSNKISSIAPGTFDGAAKLEEIRLEYNDIVKPPANGTFNKLNSLKNLDLQGQRGITEVKGTYSWSDADQKIVKSQVIKKAMITFPLYYKLTNDKILPQDNPIPGTREN